MFVRLNRRDVLRLASSGVGYAALARLTEGKAYASGPMGPTVIENLQPGSANWTLTKPALQREIEGYASLTSVNRGGQIKLFVHTAESSYTFSVYRMGWYGGAGARLMLGPISRTGVSQPMPTPDPVTGLTECNWTNPYTLTIPYDASDPTVWASGVYLVKLTAGTSGAQSYIMFVVRDDQRMSDFLFQSSVTSFQAYNNWGGKRLYNYLSSNKVRASKVSFNRPYARIANPAYAGGMGASEFLIGGDGGPPAGWEYSMVRFLERQGFDVSYCTNLDVHTDPNLLLSHNGFLSVGHDEYWSREMRQNVTAARDRGVSLGFFTANACYWQIRIEPSVVDGAANRTVVCYKYTPVETQGSDTRDPLYLDGDPSNDHLITVRWRDSLPNSSRSALPEETLIGVQYEYGDDRVDAALVVQNTGHWVFAGTGLKDGDQIPGLVGHETDTLQGNSPPGTVVLGHSPHTGNSYVTNGSSDMTLYQAGSGALVFAASSFQFMWGFDDWCAPLLRSTRLSPAAHQMAMNILTAMTRVERTGVTAPQALPGGPYVTLLGEATVFDGSASHGASSPVQSYTWDFGDGSSGTGVRPSHTYAAPGNYVVKLTIVDNKGKADDSLTSVSVQRLLWKVTAQSTWNTVYQGKRYYYPASGLNDGIIPVPTTTDLFNQWLSAGGLAVDSAGKLTTPVNLYGQLLRRTKLNAIRVYQSAYNQGSQFRTKDYRVFTRITGGQWQLVGAKDLADVNRAAKDATFSERDVDEIRIEIVSTFDLVNKAVGLSEIQIGTSTRPLSALPQIRHNGPYTAKETIPIRFDASASSDADGSIVSWRWEFGDGSTATVPTIDKAYEREGAYTARLTITDNEGNISAAGIPVTIQANRRYKTVTADSTFDVTSGGKRYFYPPHAIGDYIVPNSTETIFKQWFSASPLAFGANQVLNTPQNLYLTFYERQTVNRMRLTQAWYTVARAFRTRGFRVYTRQTGGSWDLAGTGYLQPGNGCATDVTFAPREADEARIEILSSWDNTNTRGVGLAEVEVFSGTESGNKLPIAVVNAPTIVQVGSAANLDGSGSSDPDGSIVSYEWAFSDGTTLTGPTAQKILAAPSVLVGTLTVTDNLGAKATAGFEMEARFRYRNVTASTTFDQTTGGKRFYYPPEGVGDFVVPTPTTSDLMKQWLSRANLTHTDGVLADAQSLTLFMWDEAAYSQISLRQASYTDGRGFNSKDIEVFAQVNGKWIRLGSGQLPNTGAAELTLNFPPTTTGLFKIRVLSTWDLTNKGVGLSEIIVS